VGAFRGFWPRTASQHKEDDHCGHHPPPLRLAMAVHRFRVSRRARDANFLEELSEFLRWLPAAGHAPPALFDAQRSVCKCAVTCSRLPLIYCDFHFLPRKKPGRRAESSSFTQDMVVC
jgi:hypothetical protein